MILAVPTFARLTDYLGPWCMEPAAFSDLWDYASRLDFRAHEREAVEPLKSAMEYKPMPGGKKIAVMNLSGVLMKSQSSLGGTSTVQMRRDMRQAMNDKEVAGIMMRIDSPGGTVAGTDDLAKEVTMARRQKPVWAHIDDLGASAAYWVASQADRITANSPTALVGSIGTVQVIHDQSQAAEKAGVRTLVFRTGPLKGMGSPGEKITEEQAQHVQGLVNDVQKTFDAAVMRGRNMSQNELMAVRHGGVMSADKAMQMRLIDGIQPIDRTMQEFSASLQKSPMAEHWKQVVADIDAALMQAGYGIDLETGMLVFTHNSETADSEPDWGSVDKTALPMLAFADHGDGADKKSTWGYPHHWVQNAGGKDDNGIWTTGTLLLHRGGLNAAWSAANGGRSGQKASQAVIDHLQAHRRALGLDKPSSLAALLLPTRRRLLPMIQRRGKPK